MSTTTTRVDWRKPLQAQGEETYFLDVSEDGTETPRPSIRWHVSAEGLGRIQRMEACWDCLTGFPAPPRAGNWRVWRESGFGWVHPLAESRRLVANGQCPLCKAEISAEMLALQIDNAWTEEDAKLKEAKEINLEDDRERDARADLLLANRLGLIDPVAPPSRRKSMKRRGES